MSPKISSYLQTLGERIQKAHLAAGQVLLQASGEIVPIDTGNMWSGGVDFVQPDGEIVRDGVGARVYQEGYSLFGVTTIGYTASYAGEVHENARKLHGADFNEAYRDAIAAGREHKRRPQETNLFLWRPLNDQKVRGDMVEAIRRSLNG